MTAHEAGPYQHTCAFQVTYANLALLRIKLIFSSLQASCVYFLKSKIPKAKCVIITFKPKQWKISHIEKVIENLSILFEFAYLLIILAASTVTSWVSANTEYLYSALWNMLGKSYPTSPYGTNYGLSETLVTQGPCLLIFEIDNCVLLGLIWSGKGRWDPNKQADFCLPIF